VLAAAALAACGGGGGGTDPVPTPAPTGAPVVQATPTESARLLQQAQFASTDADLNAVQSDGVSAWLEKQFNAGASISGWDWLMSNGYNTDAFRNNITPADYMVWYQLIASPDGLRKRVALALSEFFVVSSSGVNIQSGAFAMAAWWDTLVANAFGNYRSLLEAVTLNPAMGVYLNTRGNQKEDLTTGRQPDENYGREVMQLFTIGLYELNPDGSNRLNGAGQPIETYDQSAVTNLARVFTGWDLDNTGATAVTNPLQVRNPMVPVPALHSSLASSFLGAIVPANTDARTSLKIALDALFNHANVGPFFGKQLIQRLVTSNPSAAYVARVAAAFGNNGAGVRGDMKAVIRAVLLDAEARSAAVAAQPGWGKLREPMLRFVQWARTFGAVSASGLWRIGDLSDPSTRLGQSPLRAGSVFNFFRPGYVPPNTSLASAGLLAPEMQLTNESTVASWINFMQTTIRNGFGDVASTYPNELALAGDVTALVNRLNLLLCAGQLSPATQLTIRNAVATISATSPSGQQTRVQAAVLLVMAAPEYIVQK
jgi:uncharacterized protein (DUF1800 family)